MGGPTATATGTGGITFDTGIYATTTAGQLSVDTLQARTNLQPDSSLGADVGTSVLPWSTIYGKTYEIYGAAGTKYGSLKVQTLGTTDTQGETRLILGNSAATGTSNNAKGSLIMYGTNSGYTTITPGYNSSSTITLTLPSTAGTLARTADNVASATKLKTARTLTIGNKGKTFDGSGNVSWSLSEIGAVPISGGSMTGDLLSATGYEIDLGSNSNRWTDLFLKGNINIDLSSEFPGDYTPTNGERKIGFWNDDSTHAVYLYGQRTGRIGIHDGINTVYSEELGEEVGTNVFFYDYDSGAPYITFGADVITGKSKTLGRDGYRWGGLYLTHGIDGTAIEVGTPTNTNYSCLSFNRTMNGTKKVIKFGASSFASVPCPGIITGPVDGGETLTYVFLENLYAPTLSNKADLGRGDLRWRTVYTVNAANVSSDRTMKENIRYIRNNNSSITYNDMYNFVKNDLELATYNFIGDNEEKMNFIAQDLLCNADGSDNIIGQMIVNPMPVPPEEEIEATKAALAEEGLEYKYPTLSYDSGMYTSVLAGALKESINKIEELETKNKVLEELVCSLNERLSKLENK